MTAINREGQVWEYIDDGELYLILHDITIESYGRYKLFNLQTGALPTITTYAFTDHNGLKRWRRFA